MIEFKLSQLNIECHNFRLLCVTPMVTTNELSIEYTQREIKINKSMKLTCPKEQKMKALHWGCEEGC